MGRCCGCNKKLGFFEGYSTDEKEFCKQCFPKRKGILEKARTRKEKEKKEDWGDYKRKIKENMKEREKRIEQKDNKNYVLFLDIFCWLSMVGGLMGVVLRLLIGDFANIPEVTFNVLFGGFIIYILFWIYISFIVSHSDYKKDNWGSWDWSILIVLLGIVFTYIFYFGKYRPLLLKNNKPKKDKRI